MATGWLDAADDRTDSLLQDAYSHVAMALERGFGRLSALGDEQVETLAALASELGVPIEPDDLARPAPDEDQIVWRPVARSSVLELLDTAMALADHSDAWVELEPDRLAKECLHRLDAESFRRRTSLDASDAATALELTSAALVDWDVVGQPVVLAYRHQFLALAAHREPDLLGFLATPTPPLLLIEEPDPTPPVERDAYAGIVVRSETATTAWGTFDLQRLLDPSAWMHRWGGTPSSDPSEYVIAAALGWADAVQLSHPSKVVHSTEGHQSLLFLTSAQPMQIHRTSRWFDSLVALERDHTDPGSNI